MPISPTEIEDSRNRLLGIPIETGSVVEYKGRRFVLARVLSTDSVLLMDPRARVRVEAKISEIVVVATNPRSTKKLRAAERKRWAIEPLVGLPKRKRADVAARAKVCGVSTNTLYNWLARYESGGSLGSLLRSKRSDVGRSRLPQEVEAILLEVLQSEKRASLTAIAERVASECSKAGLPSPHFNTVRARITAHRRLKKRTPDTARRTQWERRTSLWQKALASCATGDFPLRALQIDHIPIDVAIAGRRTALEKPWLSIAFDWYSRIVLGHHLSLHRPNQFSIKQCIAKAILPKEQTLARLKIRGKWPCWGNPLTIHMDSTKELETLELERTCSKYGLALRVHCAQRPYLGSHADQSLGELVRSLSTPAIRKAARKRTRHSTPRRSLTPQELEQIVVRKILAYNSKVHFALGDSPLNRFEQGLLRGTAANPALGLPPRISDPSMQRDLLLDFMPEIKRTVQKYGIVIDGTCYRSHVLSRFVCTARDRRHGSYPKTVICRHDPQDMTKMWLLNPESNRYSLARSTGKNAPPSTRCPTP